MKLILSLLLALASITAVDAQRYRNPQQYLREFNNEKRKIDMKSLLYLQASLKGSEPRRIERYHEMVLEQMRESRRDLERVGPYEDYEVLKREYIKGLDMLIEAYERDFGIAEKLRENKYKSYEDLKKYYDAVTAAEDKMYEAVYKLEKAEDHFAKTYYIEFERDPEIVQEYIMLDEATLYSRDMTLSFFRVEQEVQEFLSAVKEDKHDSLGIQVGEIQKAIKESEQEVAQYADFDGEDDLYQEVLGYLEEMKEEVHENLRPVAEQLANQFLDEDEYEDAQKQLQHFINRHSGRVEDFYETRNELIEEYLPE